MTRDGPLRTRRPTGVLDALCEGSFARRPDGRVIFFPWGPAGRGYAVPDEERCARLRRQTRRLVATGLFGVPCLVAFGLGSLGAAAVAPVAALLAALCALRLAWLTRDLEPTAERTTRAEANARVARALRGLRRGDAAGEEADG